jgi:hypothetical protein
VIQQCEDPTEVVEAHDIDASIPELSTRKSTLACTAHTYLEAIHHYPGRRFAGDPKKRVGLHWAEFFSFITSHLRYFCLLLVAVLACSRHYGGSYRVALATRLRRYGSEVCSERDT